MKLDKKKITELARNIKKRLLSTVHCQIVKNMKLLLTRMRPGFASASCSLVTDNSNKINFFRIKKGLNKEQRLETLKRTLESLGLKYKEDKINEL